MLTVLTANVESREMRDSRKYPQQRQSWPLSRPSAISFSTARGIDQWQVRNMLGPISEPA